MPSCTCCGCGPWSWSPARGASFAVWVQVEALDRPGLLRDVTSVLSDLGANILASSSVVGTDRTATLRYEVELSDPGQLERAIADLRDLEGIYDALEADYPEFRLFLFSPLAAAVSLAEKAFPIMELSVTAEDKFPLMRPVRIEGPPKETLSRSGLRTCASTERAAVAFVCLFLLGGSTIAIWKGTTTS